MFSVKQPYQPKPKPQKPAYRPPPPGNYIMIDPIIQYKVSALVLLSLEIVEIFRNQSDVNLAFTFGNDHKEIRSESLLIEVLLI